MSIFKNFFVVLSCLLVFVIFGFTSTSLANQSSQGKYMFTVITNKATIKPIDGKTYRVAFHDVTKITFFSYYPDKLAGEIDAKKFIKDVWNDNSKINVAILSGNAGNKKLYAFEAVNPKYDVTTRDFIIDVIPFGDKEAMVFKAKKEQKLHNVTLSINGLIDKKKLE